ncbi:MAG: hypothetical protein WDO18_04110 [Acidobacteriota bacterium]
MSNIFIGVTFDAKVDVNTVFSRSGYSLLPRGTSGPSLASVK